MKRKSIVILLESKGHRVDYYRRPDGSIRIKEMDGKVFRGSEGNDYARRVVGKGLSPSQRGQRISARAKILPLMSTALASMNRRTMRRLRRQYRRVTAQSSAPAVGLSEAMPKRDPIAKKRKKYADDYAADQQAYRLLRRNGMSAKKALQMVKGDTRNIMGKTFQHYYFTRAQEQALLNGEGNDVLELSRQVGSPDVGLAFEANKDRLTGVIDVDTLERQAKGLLYALNRDLGEAKKAKGTPWESDAVQRYRMTLNDAKLFVNGEVQKLLDVFGIRYKASNTDWGTITAFLFEKHNTKLLKPLKEAVKEGKTVTQRDVFAIARMMTESYSASTIRDREAKQKAVIERIKGRIK